TILVLVPINSAIARGAREAGAAADAAEARRMRGDIARWDRLHRLRSLALAAAVVVEMVAVLV
ncbi:anthrone oxygenase family protein, partial [Dietzia timorensis]